MRDGRPPDTCAARTYGRASVHEVGSWRASSEGASQVASLKLERMIADGSITRSETRRTRMARR